MPVSKLSKKTVELKPEPRPSRIRREPVPANATLLPEKIARLDPAQRETWIVVIGVVLFAIALTALSIGIGEVTSH